MKKTKKPRTKVSGSPKKPSRSIKATGTTEQQLLKTLSSLSEDDLRRFLESAVQLGKNDFDLPDPEEAETQFAALLDICEEGEGADNDQIAEIVPELISLLSDVRISANGGSPKARGEVEAILEMLDEALEDAVLDGGALMMIAKVLADAGWPVPDSLKQASLDLLQSGPKIGEREAGDPKDLIDSLVELSEQLENDEFALFEHISSMFAAFPPEASAHFVGNIVELGRGVLDRAIVGFALHPEPAVAAAALDALSGISSRPVESLIVERLVRMRPWVTPERRANLDAAIKTLRQSAQPPVKEDLAPVDKLYLSVCDGAGAHQIIATTRNGRVRSALALLVKPQGVADLAVLDDLSKADVDQLVVTLKSTTPAALTDIASAARMLALSLAPNLESGVPPPYRLVQFVERLGLGAVTPSHDTPAEIAAECLGDLADVAADATVLARAHAEIVGSELMTSWFEAGEAVEDLLAPTKTRAQRIKKLLTVYLPQRRAFWARQCAISALALRGPAAGKAAPYCLALARIARDLASDRPIDQMPLMREIAGETASAFAHNSQWR